MFSRHAARNSHTWLVWLIMLLGLLLRLSLVMRMHYAPIEWDQLNYTEMAVRWWETGVYGYIHPEPNTLVTPGYPSFLVLVFAIFGYHPIEHGLMVVRVLQSVIGTGAIGLIYLLGRRLYDPAVGVLAALFAAIYAQYIMSTTLILTEVLFLTTFMAFLYFQVRVIQDNRLRDHLWMGILLAASVLIRPNVLPLAVIPYLFLWVKHRRLFLPMIAASVGAFAVLMLPWWIRNFITFHAFIPIAKGESGNPFLAGTDPYFAGTIDTSKIKPDDQFAEGMRRLKQGLRDDPWLWIRWFTVGKFNVFFSHRWLGAYPAYIPAWLNTLQERLHYILVYVGWIWLAVSAFFNRSSAFLAVSALIFLGIHSLFIPVDRYSYGMMPFLMLGTAHLVVWAASTAFRKIKTPARA